MANKIKSSLDPPKKPDNKPILVYSGQKTFKSYEENGLDWKEDFPPGPTDTDEPERFLSEVEPNYVDKETGKKKPIRVEIRQMARRKVRQPDPKTSKMSSIEVLTYLEDWYGVDWLGEKIAPATGEVPPTDS
jgi:hypothetical protein